MKKKRLILHVGTHKTGSTTIQNALYRSRAKILEQGYCYPSYAMTPERGGPKHVALWRALHQKGLSFEDYWNGVLAEFEASEANTLIMSEEALGVLALRHRGAAERLRKLAETFDLAMIFYLRRQDTFVESFWNQQAKDGRTQFHIGKYAAQDRIRTYLRYIDIIERWEAFAKVHVVGFESACATGLLDSFTNLTGASLMPEEKRRNVSPSMTCAAVLAALSRSTGKRYNWRKVEQHLGEGKRWTALGRVRRQLLLDRFADQRDALQRKYGIVFPDTMPDEPDEMIERPTARDVVHLARPELLA